MGMMLEDGSVVPHYLGLRSTAEPEDSGAYSNDLLRVGEVVDVVYANDSRSRSKKVTEYVVSVQHYDRNLGTSITHTYPRCVLSTTFGSVADHCVYTLRFDKSASKNQQTGLGLGAKVLLLCMNAEQNQPVILAAIADQSDKSQEGSSQKDLGHHFNWLFNGIEQVVNKDGEWSITYNGKSNLDGTTDSSVNQAGSQVTITKDGKVNILPKQGLMVGQATDFALLGQSFRDAQQQMNSSLQGQFNSLQALLQTAATALTTAGGSMATPIAGAVAAAPQITTAGTALVAAAKLVGQISRAFQQFEQSAGQKNSFLSKLNKFD